MRMRTFAILTGCLCLLAASGCSGSPKAGNSRPGAEIAMTRHNPLSLYNYTLGREYSASGRYELAREHYLIAYAAAQDDAVLQDMLQKELKAVDLMIHSLR